MKIELRNVKLSVSLSEETPAYTALLYVQGVKVAHLSNHGFGAADSVDWFDKGAEDHVNAYFAALPTEKHYGMDLQPSLETWAHTEVWAQQDAKRMKASAKRKLTAYAGGVFREWKIKPELMSATQRAQIIARYPDARFIHECGETELRAILNADFAKNNSVEV